MEKSEILEFVRRMKPRDHVIMFYSNSKDKRTVLFAYLKAGLDQGEAAAYVAGEESPKQIKRAMEKVGIDVDGLERSGALRVIDYRDWYFAEDKFRMEKTMELWKRLRDESAVRGFKGLRVVGEMACFFKRGSVKELIEYEKSLHRVLAIPMIAICAYNSNVVAAEGRGKLYLDLIKAHSTVIFLGPDAGVVKSY